LSDYQPPPKLVAEIRAEQKIVEEMIKRAGTAATR